MELVGASRVVKVEDAADQEAAKAEFKQLAEKWSVIDLDRRILVLTIDDDSRELPEFSWVSLPQTNCREMRFERNYLHDGLSAGINAKGANKVIIKDNIVERTAGFGIAVAIDPYWWEGNPSRNIEITRNTVRNCGYFGDQSGIAVYFGGSFNNRPGFEPFGQVHDGVHIAHNAIYSSAGPGISIIGAKNVEIRGNVITDCSTCNRKEGSVFLNAVADGTVVEGNVFVGWDASIENVQIKTGLKTKSHSIVVRGNLCANPEIPIPDVAWEFIPFTDQAVEFHDAEWHVYEPDAQKESFEEGAVCLFHFEGSRVRWLAITAQWMGLSDVWIDDEFMATVDISRWEGHIADGRFTSPLLREGQHCLKIRNRGEAGKFTSGDRKGVSIYGFDVLPPEKRFC